MIPSERGVILLVGGTLEGGPGRTLRVAGSTGEFEVPGPSDCEAPPPTSGPDKGLADTGGGAFAVGGLAGGE